MQKSPVLISEKLRKTQTKRLPDWLRRSLPPESAVRTHQILRHHRMVTVCEEARCPNASECYAKLTATFMIMGDTCTRNCRFCSVKNGKPEPLDRSEPGRVARAVQELKLRYVVITSVDRDDLTDEGAGHFAETIRLARETSPEVLVEVLTPDFHAREELIGKVTAASPDVFNHNLETVERLQRSIRPQAGYSRSLKVLATVKRLSPKMTTKSGIMLGLGETADEAVCAARDLAAAGCDILTLGQYLSPGEGFHPVERFVFPEEFNEIAGEVKGFGFKQVFAGPYVRSSYHAGEVFKDIKRNHAKMEE